jgi:hypothetical protein
MRRAHGTLPQKACAPAQLRHGWRPPSSRNSCGRPSASNPCRRHACEQVRLRAHGLNFCASGLGFGVGGLGLHTGFLSTLPFLSKSAAEVFPLFLYRQELPQEIAAFVLSYRLVPYHLHMLCAEAFNPSLKSPPFGGKPRGQRPRRNPFSEGDHLTPKTTFKNRARKRIHLQALITLTYFSCCTTEQPRLQQRQRRRSRPRHRTWSMGPLRPPCHPSLHVPSPRPSGWQTTLTAQLPAGQTLPLYHIQFRNMDPISTHEKTSQLTKRRQPRLGVEHSDPAHQVVVHGQLRGDSTGPHHCHLSNARWRGGSSPYSKRNGRRHHGAWRGDLRTGPRQLHFPARVHQPDGGLALLPLHILTVFLHHC